MERVRARRSSVCVHPPSFSLSGSDHLFTRRIQQLDKKIVLRYYRQRRLERHMLLYIWIGLCRSPGAGGVFIFAFLPGRFEIPAAVTRRRNLSRKSFPLGCNIINSRIAIAIHFHFLFIEALPRILSLDSFTKILQLFNVSFKAIRVTTDGGIYLPTAASWERAFDLLLTMIV
jgi:hypothetical protein